MCAKDRCVQADGGPTSKDRDPLAMLDLQMIPAVATPMGNTGVELDNLLAQLASRTVAQFCSSFPTQPPEKAYNSLKLMYLHQFRSIMAVALAKAVAASFTPYPASRAAASHLLGASSRTRSRPAPYLMRAHRRRSTANNDDDVTASASEEVLEMNVPGSTSSPHPPRNS